MAFSATVIPGRKEIRDRSAADSWVHIVYLDGYWDDLTTAIFTVYSVWGIWHCLWVWDTRAVRLHEICWLLSWFSAPSDNHVSFQRASNHFILHFSVFVKISHASSRFILKRFISAYVAIAEMEIISSHRARDLNEHSYTPRVNYHWSSLCDRLLWMIPTFSLHSANTWHTGY